MLFSAVGKGLTILINFFWESHILWYVETEMLTFPSSKQYEYDTSNSHSQLIYFLCHQFFFKDVVIYPLNVKYKIQVTFSSNFQVFFGHNLATTCFGAAFYSLLFHFDFTITPLKWKWTTHVSDNEASLAEAHLQLIFSWLYVLHVRDSKLCCMTTDEFVKEFSKAMLSNCRGTLCDEEWGLGKISQRKGNDWMCAMVIFLATPQVIVNTISSVCGEHCSIGTTLLFKKQIKIANCR